MHAEIIQPRLAISPFYTLPLLCLPTPSVNHVAIYNINKNNIKTINLQNGNKIFNALQYKILPIPHLLGVKKSNTLFKNTKFSAPFGYNIFGHILHDTHGEIMITCSFDKGRNTIYYFLNRDFMPIFGLEEKDFSYFYNKLEKLYYCGRLKLSKNT